MHIYSITIAKNEEDIIGYFLDKVAEWSDKTFIMDNGSTDRTWEIIQEKASQYSNLVAWKKWEVPFNDGLRAEVFNHFRSIAKKGDWWCFRADCDEFYLDDPRDFLGQVPSSYHYVCKDSIEYYLTHEDLIEHQLSNRFPEDMEKIRYYAPYTFSEARFFRHRDRLTWKSPNPFPRHMGIVYPKKIRVKHYPLRNPIQIQKRLDTRNEAKKAGFDGFHHIQETHYLQAVKNRKNLCFDPGSTPLKLQGCRNTHLHSPINRIGKKVLHGIGILP